jgi:hypothetical protein
MIQFGQAMPVVVYVDGEIAKNKGAVPKGSFPKLHQYLLKNSVPGLDRIEKIEPEKIEYMGDLTDYDKLDLLSTHTITQGGVTSGLNMPPEEDSFAFSILATNEHYDEHREFNKATAKDPGKVDLPLFLKAAGYLKVFLKANGDIERVECQTKQTEFQRKREEEYKPILLPHKTA